MKRDLVTNEQLWALAKQGYADAQNLLIRLPLLIYGADVNITEDITNDQLPALVDNNS